MLEYNGPGTPSSFKQVSSPQRHSTFLIRLAKRARDKSGIPNQYSGSTRCLSCIKVVRANLHSGIHSFPKTVTVHKPTFHWEVHTFQQEVAKMKEFQAEASCRVCARTLIHSRDCGIWADYRRPRRLSVGASVVEFKLRSVPQSTNARRDCPAPPVCSVVFVCEAAKGEGAKQIVDIILSSFSCLVSASEWTSRKREVTDDGD